LRLFFPEKDGAMQFSPPLWFIVLALIAAAIPSTSATYHVAVNGDDNHAGSASAPLKTFPAAAVKAAAGDSIIVAAGAYTLSATINLTKSGTSAKPIFLLAATEQRPILDFSSMPVASGNRGVQLSGSYWHIKGLIIKGAGDNGMNVSGDNNVLEFCDFTENRDSGCQLGGRASNNRIINCDSYYNCDPGEGNADGFSPKLDVGSGNEFTGCRSWQNSDDGWDGYLRGADNVSTRLENCWCFKNGYRKNGSESTGNGNGFKMGGSDDKTLKHNFTLIRCLAFQNRVKGFDQNNNRGSMTLYNCTAFGNGTNYAIDGQTSTLVAVNCIAAGSGSSSLKGGTQTTDNLNAASSNFVSVDPAAALGARKADGSLPDITFMHLSTGSNLIDAGAVIEAVSYNGVKPDLGCFETGNSSATLFPTISSPIISGHPRSGEAMMLFDLAGRKVMNAAYMPKTNVRGFKLGNIAAGRFVYKPTYSSAAPRVAAPDRFIIQ
jgi:hypothetical protein